jgi:hypothetical protein
MRFSAKEEGTAGEEDLFHLPFEHQHQLSRTADCNTLHSSYSLGILYKAGCFKYSRKTCAPHNDVELRGVVGEQTSAAFLSNVSRIISCCCACVISSACSACLRARFSMSCKGLDALKKYPQAAVKMRKQGGAIGTDDTWRGAKTGRRVAFLDLLILISEEAKDGYTDKSSRFDS